MFIVLLLLSSAFNLSLSRPLFGAIKDRTPLVVFERSLAECANVAGFRTTQNIVWGCIAMIFASSWVAAHPNLPGPGDSKWTRFKRRIILVIYGMVAPEFMMAWAVRQRTAAQSIVRDFNKTNEIPANRAPGPPNKFWACIEATTNEWFEDPRNVPDGWTLAHGFFIQMGGFILFDNQLGEAKRVLTYDDLKELIAKGEVDPPRPSEHEINGRSRDDFMIRLLVTVLIIWFISQCAARWAENLPVTQLEVVTFAFVVINVFTFCLWWKKPQNAILAIPVPLRPSISTPGPTFAGPSTSRSEDKRRVEWLPAGERGQESCTTRVTPTTHSVKEAWTTRKTKEAINRGWFGFTLVPMRLVQGALGPVGKMWGFRSSVDTGSLRVPMFYADWDSDQNTPLVWVITFLFAGLHLIPWSSHSFPTTAERYLWRSSAIVITAEPVINYLYNITSQFSDRHTTWFSEWLVMALGVPSALGLPLFFIARLMLLALAFTTLRALPQDAYRNIDWTTFFPHL